MAETANRSSSGRSTRRHARSSSLAREADRHACYERAVQAPEVDVDFIRRTFMRLRKRAPRSLREDFCGTAAMCAAWAKAHRENWAWGLDLHRPTLEWGIRRHIRPLGPAAARITLIERDVRQPVDFKCDVVAAFNFSYFIFKERAILRDYFASALRGLNKDGILYLDLYGGPEAMERREERTEYDEFTYVWDQDAFNPITHEITNHIHFEFPDGSVMRRAYTYKWRLWQIPELRDLIREVGFRDCLVYWEGTDQRTGEGNGIYRPSLRGDSAPAYVCYILCVK